LDNQKNQKLPKLHFKMFVHPKDKMIVDPSAENTAATGTAQSPACALV
jgi:hypothetical protein